MMSDAILYLFGAHTTKNILVPVAGIFDQHCSLTIYQNIMQPPVLDLDGIFSHNR
jgi:hypothetical protein